MTRKFWLGLTIFLFTPFASFAAELPLEDFTRSDELGGIKLSPDGEFLAITTGQHGGEFLNFVNLKDRKVAAAVRAPEGLEINEFHWASNERVIFMIAQRQPGRVTPTPTGEIFAVDRDGSKQQRIYGYRAGEFSTGTHQRVRQANYASADVVTLLDGDDRNIIISEMRWRETASAFYYDPDAKPQLTRLDIYNGKEANLGSVPLASASVIVDREDIPRFALGWAEGRRFSVAWKPTKDAKWEAFELPGFREETVEPIRFAADNRSVFFTGVERGQRYAALYQLNLEDHSVKKAIEIPDTDVLQVITDFEDRETIGVRGYREKLVHQWLLPDHPAARLQRAFEKAFEGNEVRFVSRSADGKRAILFVQSDVAPGEYFLVDTQTKKADMIRAARRWVNLNDMRRKEPIKITTRDGLTVHGYLTRPAGDAPHPMIVLPHGGPHGIRDTWSYDWEAQLFANRGYAVLQVNYRGSGGYGIDFMQAGYREWGARMQDDVTDATRWAIEQKIAAPDRICIFGASYGGFAALMGVAREPALYRCAVGYAGVYDLELMRSTGDISDSKSGLSYLDLVLGTDVASMRARSPTNHAEKIQVPVYLIHGKEDWRADHKQATRMKTALERFKKPVEWVSLRGEGHGVYDDETRKQVYESILKFVGTHTAPRGEQ